VSKEFLLKERWKAYREKITKDCRFEKCHKCGVCRKEIKNVLFYEKNIIKSKNLNKNGEKKEVWYEVIYCKKGKSVFLSQLEVIRLFILTLRKLGIPLSYTSGFNPHPRIITGDALPVGVFSEKEHLAFASTQSGLAGVLNGVEIYKGLKILKVTEKKQKPTLKTDLKFFIIKIKNKNPEIVSKLKKLKNSSEKEIKVKIFENGEKIYLEVKKENFSILKFLQGGLEINLESSNVLEVLEITKLSSAINEVVAS
jgi:radical SAM-linked protein